MLLKFGGNHLGRGIDATGTTSLGNFITEFADGLGTHSLHIPVAAAAGKVEQMAGEAQPDTVVDLETGDNDALRSFRDEAFHANWTVFDLRPRRSSLDALSPIDRETERLIFGYDLLVLIPQVTPDPPIESLR